MDNLITMCLMGIFVIVGLALMSRLFGNGGLMGGTDYSRRGDETSHYDDPDIESGGGFSRRAQPGSGGTSSRPSGGSAGPRVDSPKINSRGSFGRSKR